MAALRRYEKELLLLAEDEGDLDDEETQGFYLYFTEGVNPLPHRNYPRFELDKYTDEECVNSFRFRKTDVAHLATALRLPHRFLCRNGTVAGCIEGLCILLRRLAYPIRLTNMIPMFGRSKSELSMILNDVVDFVFNQHHSLLDNLNVPWMAPETLMEMARAVHDKRAALDNVWGFVDGTVSSLYGDEYNYFNWAQIVKCNSLLYAPNNVRVLRWWRTLIHKTNIITTSDLMFIIIGLIFIYVGW